MGHAGEPGENVKPLMSLVLMLGSTWVWADPPKANEKEPLSLDFLEFLAEFADEQGDISLPEAADDSNMDTAQPGARIVPTEPLVIEPAIPVESAKPVGHKPVGHKVSI